MRVVLKDADIRFILDLLRKEKEKHDIETEDLRQEINLLEVWIKRWRWRLIHWNYYEFVTGLDYMKARLSYLKSQQNFGKTWQYSEALDYLTARYESMLRGKTGRPLGVHSYGRKYVEAVVEEKVSH
ncbi:MAG: hypothetical protein OEX01_08725 [Candidatus Bathyarchaeota archaeon]|nr:hypothetical protein [Candidatus Bathyarchaeota archaeon]